MPTLGLENKTTAKNAGVLNKGHARSAGKPKPKSSWSPILAYNHLALGLPSAKRCKLTLAQTTELQEKLAALGFYKGEIDGLDGPETRKAHEAYRKSLCQWGTILPPLKLAEKVALAGLAEARAKVKEEGGNNRGPRVEEYLKSIGLKPGEPWCAAFVCWCMAQAAKAEDKVPFALPREGAAFRFEDWAVANQKNGVQLLDPEHSNLKRGDLIVFSFSHIAICTGRSDGNGEFRTVEGNTTSGPSKAESERDGGGVYERVRNLKTVRSAIRMCSTTVSPWMLMDSVIV